MNKWWSCVPDPWPFEPDCWGLLLSSSFKSFRLFCYILLLYHKQFIWHTGRPKIYQDSGQQWWGIELIENFPNHDVVFAKFGCVTSNGLSCNARQPKIYHLRVLKRGSQSAVSASQLWPTVPNLVTVLNNGQRGPLRTTSVSVSTQTEWITVHAKLYVKYINIWHKNAEHIHIDRTEWNARTTR